MFNFSVPYEIDRVLQSARKPIFTMRFRGFQVPPGTYILTIKYKAKILDTADGLFQGTYIDMNTGEKKYVEK